MYAIRSYYVDSTESLNLSINDYAVEMFSFTNSTIDKDKQYSDFKKNEELKSMTSLVERLSKDIRITSYNVCYTKLLR